LREADITYGNHEGPSSRGITASGRLVADPGPVFDDYVYTSFPQFNYHASLEPALVRAGFNVVSTANNHALDRYSLGADRTLDALGTAGLRHTGTVRANGSGYWSSSTTHGTMDIRWLACTFGTNGIEDPHGQVLRCYSDAAKLESLVRSLASRPEIDAVIVTPHWGQEYTNVPEARQIALAHRLLDAGATMVIGSHPHVLQPWEKYITRDGRETLIAYSLGNFVSHQDTLARQSTILLYAGLVRRADGKTVLTGARYMPLYMNHAGGRWRIEAIDAVGGPADSRALITDLFDKSNIRSPSAPLRLRDGCI
jgi:poly-gamma-glutamate capsule biosynthesis protein CapA/YwtB (metallophosphatase superfamily)